MPVAGIDIGSSTAKIVILDHGKILASELTPVTSNVKQAADIVLQLSLKRAGLQRKDLKHVISTGYGRNAVDFADATKTEIICHARGVHYWIPDVRTVVDIGAQDSKVIRVDSQGDTSGFVMNDKCAAGSGRFLELMAQTLGINLNEMGPRSVTSNSPSQISSTCTVFAESEVVSLRAEGHTLEDLLAGIHQAIAKRVFLMGASLRFEAKAVFTGGVARNIGVKKALEKVSSIQFETPDDPQLTGALGAALIAEELAGQHEA